MAALASNTASAPIGGLFGDISPPVMPAALEYLRSMLTGQQAQPGQGSAPDPSSAPPAMQPPQAVQPAPAAPAMSPPPAPAPQAAPDNSGMPTFPLTPHRNVLLDTIDNLFLGGNVERARQANYGRQLATVQIQNALRYISKNVPEGPERDAAFSNPLGYMQTVNARMQPTKLGPMDTLTHGALTGGDIHAPMFDPVSGKMVGVGADGNVSASPSVGGGFSVDSSGNVISARTGPATSVPVFQHFPRTDNHGFVEPNAPGATPGGAPPPGPMDAGTAPQPAPGPTGAPPPIPAHGAPAEVASAITARAAAAGASPDDANQLVGWAKIESGLNPRTRNNGSSTGLLQYHPTTYSGLGGKNITDPSEQVDVGVREIQQNRAALQQSGLPVTSTSLYLAHQQGLGGARALYSADPKTRAVDAIAPIYVGRYGQIRGNSLARQAIVNNGGSVTMTAGDFLAKWDGKVAAAMPSGGATAAPGAPAASAPPNGALGSENLSDGGPVMGAPTTVSGLPGQWQKNSVTGELSPLAGTAWTPTDAASVRKGVQESKEYENAEASLSAYGAMVGNADKMTGPSAYAMLDTMARTVNPQGAVRMGTLQLIKETFGLSDRLVGQIQGAEGKGPLPAGLRQQILDAVLPFAQNHWDQANALNQQAVRIGARHGFTADDVTAPLGARPGRYVIGQGELKIPTGAPTATGPNGRKIYSDGKVWRDAATGAPIK